jgi:hypothetical protein
MSMQENEHFDPKSIHCREALMALITKHGRVGREQLLDAVFSSFDNAISELVHSGRLVVEKAPHNESHLDTFILAELERP